jgi:hypothetical protein
VVLGCLRLCWNLACLLLDDVSASLGFRVQGLGFRVWHASFLTTFPLGGFFWLRPEKVSCSVFWLGSFEASPPPPDPPLREDMLASLMLGFSNLASLLVPGGGSVHQ